MGKKSKAGEVELKPYNPVNTVPAKILYSCYSVSHSQLLMQKLRSIESLLYRLPEESDAVFNLRIVKAVEMYEGLAPTDMAESMIAEQMIGTHQAALECLRRASLPEQPLANRDMNLKHAQKLMALFAQQLSASNKHRGKGQQKVTVEHVHVEAGGQAIVGNVETGPGERNMSSPVKSISESSDQTVDDALNGAGNGQKAKVSRK